MSVAGPVGIGGIVMAAALAIGSGAPGAAPPPKDIVLTSIGAYDTPFFDQGAVEITSARGRSRCGRSPARCSGTAMRSTTAATTRGPEPEGIAVAKLWGRDYVFLALERIGGVMVYEVTDPVAPRFVQYINERNFAAPPSSPNARDLGAEGVVVIESSANGAPLLLVSNEVSGTLRVFRIDQAK